MSVGTPPKMFGRPYKKPLYCWRSTPRMCTYTRAHAQNGNRHFCHFFKLSPEVRPCRSRCWRPRSRCCWPPRPPRQEGRRTSVRTRTTLILRVQAACGCNLSWWGPMPISMTARALLTYDERHRAHRGMFRRNKQGGLLPPSSREFSHHGKTTVRNNHHYRF